MDKLKDKLKTAAIVLGSVKDGKVSLIAGVTADATSRSRPVSWSTSLPSRWAARVAAARTWPRPAAPNRQPCRARCKAWRAGSSQAVIPTGPGPERT
jgi:hypothetical protein